MKHNIKRVYLDYNIYDGLSKKQFEINRNNIEVYCSVAHIEEYFKASKNANNINNTEKLLQVKKTILDLSKKEIILNPSKTRIVAKAESFDTCYARISNMDTTKIIETDSNSIFSNIKNSVQQIQTADSTAKNYSNLDEKEIWTMKEVISHLENFPKYYEIYMIEAPKKLYSIYGASALKKNTRPLPKSFNLENGCLKNNISFNITELIIEFMNNVLCLCGYNKDKNQQTTLSGIYDVSHMIYATYCDYFITNDERLKRRAKAIYYYLGIDTIALSLDDFNKSNIKE